jgi:adenine-specific DNA-methyltransferase
MKSEARSKEGAISNLDRTVTVYRKRPPTPKQVHDATVWNGDVEVLLNALRGAPPMFDLVITSPPYNLGKAYERDQMLHLDEYKEWQQRVIHKIGPLLKPSGSICWQVGNYVSNGHILPLDIVLHPCFDSEHLILRNRIIWHFGHGLHCKKRFSGRYEVVMWYTTSDDYFFDLDAVRVPSKYPGKRAFKGPHLGQLTSNPNGKNPGSPPTAARMGQMPRGTFQTSRPIMLRRLTTPASSPWG